MSERVEFISYAEFIDALKSRASYETMYEDSEGRMILVVAPLDLYSFVNRLWDERKVWSGGDTQSA